MGVWFGNSLLCLTAGPVFAAALRQTDADDSTSSSPAWDAAELCRAWGASLHHWRAKFLLDHAAAVGHGEAQSTSAAAATSWLDELLGYLQSPAIAAALLQSSAQFEDAVFEAVANFLQGIGGAAGESLERFLALPAIGDDCFSDPLVIDGGKIATAVAGVTLNHRVAPAPGDLPRTSSLADRRTLLNLRLLPGLL